MVTFSPFLNGDRSTVLAKWYTVLPSVTVWALPASIAEMTPVAEVLVEANAAVPVARAATRASGSRNLRIDGLRFCARRRCRADCSGTPRAGGDWVLARLCTPFSRTLHPRKVGGAPRK